MSAPISPRAHRRFDHFAFPGLMALAFWMGRRNRRAGAVVATIAVAEGAAHVTTDYPPPIALPWMDFREHNQMAVAQGAIFAILGAVLPGLSRRERGVILGLSMVPIALAALSDTSRAARARTAREDA